MPDKKPEYISNTFKKYPGLAKLINPADYTAEEASGKLKDILNKNKFKLEYLDKNDDKYIVGKDTLDTPITGKNRIYINPDMTNQKSRQSGVDLDLISHGLSNSNDYNKFSKELESKLLTKYSKQDLENNGGVAAYVRGYLSDDKEYKPYKDEMKFLPSNYFDPLNNLLGTQQMKNGAKVKKYKDGFFVDNADPLYNGANFASGVLNNFSNPNRANTSLKGAQGALQGAGMGLKVAGPWGAAVGGAIGLGAGLIGGHKASQRIQKQSYEQVAGIQDDLSNHMATVNIDPYGQQMYGDGGTILPPAIIVGKNNKKITRLYPKGDLTPKDIESLKALKNIKVNEALNRPINKPNETIQYGEGDSDMFKQLLNKKYAQGADVIDSNIINIEKGELQIDPQSGKILREYKGINPETGGMYEPHNKKGKDVSHNLVSADPGTFIITKKKASDYKDAIDNNDKIRQTTILQNIRNAKKANTDKFEDGDEVPQTKDQYWNQWNDWQDHINTPQVPLTSGNPATGINASNPLFNTPNASIAPYTTPQQTAKGPSWLSQNGQGILDNVSKYGSSAFNITQGLFGKVNKQSYGKKFTNPYLGQIEANMPQNVDLQPMINDAYDTQRIAEKDLGNNVNSSAVYRANRQQLNSNTNRNLSNVRMQAQQINNQSRLQRANIYNNLGSQDIQNQESLRNYNLGIDDINTRSQAAKQKSLGTGLEQLQQTYMNDQYNKKLDTQDANKEAMDAFITSNVLPSIYPSIKGYKQYDPEFIKNWMKNYNKKK